MSVVLRRHPVAPRRHTGPVARRYDRDRVLVAQVAAAVERGDSPAELVETAGGRLDILTCALAQG